MSYRVALVIPCFNHADPLKGLLTKLADLNLPAYLVDDGSAPSEQEKINRLLPDFPFVRLVRRQENGGKGAAVIDGALAAQKDSFTHILQIDADGQHDTADIPTLLALSKEHPDTLISGFPLYDDSVPKGRLIGRYITHFWVWAETLSSTIVDSMCGFRVYPLVPLLSIVQNDKPGRHMDFDPEILVRLYWAGVPMKFIPTRVIYPKGGTSNFDAVHDNWRITKMHTKLFCKSVLLWPQLIGRNRRAHWSQLEERRGLLGMQFLLAVYRIFGRRFFDVVLLAPLSVFWLVAKEQRQASEDYLTRLRTYADRNAVPLEGPLTTFRHFHAFAEAVLDKFAAWMGDINPKTDFVYEDDETRRLLTQKKGESGKILFVSHIGCAEVTRAVAENDYEVHVNALVFERHAPRFKAVMEKIAPKSHVNLIAVDSVGAQTAQDLIERLARGEWVAIAADRTPVRPDGKTERTVTVPFLGKPAPFPIGPYVLASLLKRPVLTLFADRKGHTIRIRARLFSERITLPRKEREAALTQYAERFAHALQTRALAYPLNWFNFFDFWAGASDTAPQTPPKDLGENSHDNA